MPLVFLIAAAAAALAALGCGSRNSNAEPSDSAADYQPFDGGDEDGDETADSDDDQGDDEARESKKDRREASKKKRGKGKRKGKSRRKSDGERLARTHGLPDTCEPKGSLCLPPPAFVRRLCRHRHPDVAVYMMRKDQPWSHRYVRVEQAHAVNPITGRVGETKLLFGEEVLVLRYRAGASTGEMQVSGMEGYDILRWDGTCASLAEGELVPWMPPKQVRYALFDWRRLGGAYRAKLLEDSRVAALEEQQREACRGATIGRGPRCEKVTSELNAAIAKAVQGGIDLPPPKRRP